MSQRAVHPVTRSLANPVTGSLRLMKTGWSAAVGPRRPTSLIVGLISLTYDRGNSTNLRHPRVH